MISYYELLGLIKDGNPPKKVKFNESVFEWNGSCYFNEDDDYNERFLSKIFVEFSMLNERCIKIVEKPVEEPIEELYISKNDITYPDGAINDDELVDCILEITSKINKLIKEVNKLRKEDK